MLLYLPQIAWLASVVVNEKNAMRCVLTPSRLAESARPGRPRIADRRHGPGGENGSAKGRELQEIIKEAVGIHVPLPRSLFGCDILSRLLLRVSLAKPTSAPLRF